VVVSRYFSTRAEVNNEKSEVRISGVPTEYLVNTSLERYTKSLRYRVGMSSDNATIYVSWCIDV
jgi:hypothetical protein